ncbi:protein spaetzle-like isoform X2 [Eupeodes corollae]|uniref:protein spaetzle-like isoform X2 n=1 Tax=Eupeodes corollae TaxID=290404 RepID=UPI002492F1D9|nr:protein spaetzle-like isoform X2 [Eupeodes corollae]
MFSIRQITVLLIIFCVTPSHLQRKGTPPVPVFPEYESFCQSFRRLVYPKAAESIDGRWKLIVNHPNFTQAMEIEECINLEAECMFPDSFPAGSKTMCRQCYHYRELLSYSPEKKIVTDRFKFPSCCKCTFTLPK